MQGPDNSSTPRQPDAPSPRVPRGTAAADAMDARSAEEFVRHFSVDQHRILRFVHTLVPQLADAEDILQETSVVLWEKWPEFDRSKSFAKWACGIARLEVFQMYRSRKRSSLYLSESVLEQIADVALLAVDEELRDQASSDALHQCLGELPERHRQMLQLRYLHEKTIHQIAEQCGRPKSSVHDLLQKLRTMLLKCVRRRLGP